MKITTEKPTEPGWYWIQSKYIHPDGKIFVGEVFKEEGYDGLMLFAGRTYSLEASWITQNKCLWAGPIPNPFEEKS